MKFKSFATSELSKITVTIISFLFACNLYATPITVSNYSFEDPQMPDNGYTLNNIPGWIRNGSTVGVFNPSDSHYPNSTGTYSSLPSPAEGSQLAYINNTATITSQGAAAIVQDNTTYTLKVAVGSRLDAPTTGSTYRISLLVNGIEEAFDTLLVDSSVLSPGTFIDMTTSFTTAQSNDVRSGGNLQIRLAYFEDNTLEGQGNFDNVRLDAVTVPEPCSIALMLISGIIIKLRKDSTTKLKA